MRIRFLFILHVILQIIFPCEGSLPAHASWGFNYKGYVPEQTPFIISSPIKFSSFKSNYNPTSVSIGKEFAIFVIENRLYTLGNKNIDVENTLNVIYMNPYPVDMSNIFALFGQTFTVTKLVTTQTAAAVLINDTVFTWGYSQGSLGNLKDIALLPTKVEFPKELNVKVVDIAAGDDFIVVSTSSGSVYCWGSFPWRNVMIPFPTILEFNERILSIGAGNNHVHAISARNTLYIWGQFGETVYETPQKVDILNDSNFIVASGKDIMIGAIHSPTSAKVSYSDIFIVGENEFGLFQTVNTTFPAEDPGLISLENLKLPPIRSITLNRDGTALFITEDTIYQAGNILGYEGKNYTLPFPQEFSRISNLAKVIGGYTGFAAMTTIGEIYFWGSDFSGRFTGDPHLIPSPRSVPYLANFDKISITTSHMVATNASGLYGWGLLHPHYTPVLTPIQISDIEVGKICGGDGFIIATSKEMDRCYSIGNNLLGQLGRTRATDTDFGLVEWENGGMKIQTIRSGDTHTLLLTINGNLYGWGDSSNGQLGPNGSSSLPSLLQTDVKTVIAGSKFSILLLSNSTVIFWGITPLCESDNGFRNTCPDIRDIHSVAAGNGHVLLLTNDGRVYAFGGNDISQANPELDESDVPLSLVNINGYQYPVSKIWAVGNTSFARLTNGDIYIWGYSLNRFIVFFDSNQLSMRLSPNNNRMMKLQMEGDLVNRDIIDIYGSNDIIFFYTEETPEELQCVSSKACFINGTREYALGARLQMPNAPLYVRGKLLLSNGSSLYMSRSTTDTSHLIAIDGGCVEIKGANLFVTLNETTLPDDGPLQVTVVKGCYVGSFQAIQVRTENCELESSILKSSNTLQLAVFQTRECSKSKKLKWYLYLIMGLGAIALIVFVIIIFLKLRANKCQKQDEIEI